MQIKHLSKRDAVLLIEIIHGSVSCSEVQYANMMLRKLNNLLEFRAATSCIGRAAPDGALEAWKLFDINYSLQYIEAYVEAGLHKQDPLILQNFKNYKLQRWSDVFQKHSAPKKLLSLCQDFGFNKIDEVDGYIHGVCNMKGQGGSLFSFYGLKNNERNDLILDLVIPHLHEAMRRLCNISKRVAPLSGKETEVLKWLKQGKSTWDISVILRISERTVKFHVGNIMRKLDASSRTHAVAIAIEQGLVDIE